MLELMVVMGILLLLMVLLLPAIIHMRSQADSTRCLANLNMIGTAFRTYAARNGDLLPDPGNSGQPWEAMISTYADEGLYKCPADPELYSALGSSYDWRDTGDPDTTLAGKPLSPSIRSDAVMAFDSLPGWHSRGFMNVVLADGAAKSLDQEKCLNDLLQPVGHTLTTGP